jgi:hypothetical protein
MTDETVEIKIKTEDKITWKIEESDIAPKTTEWFWALGILALAFIVFSILLKNYLLTIIVALAAFIIYSNKNKKPELINFCLDNKGLSIEQKFYPYDNFESFWIFPGRTDKKQELALRQKQRWAPLLIIPFYSKDKNRIEEILATHLAENEEQESLIDLLRKRFF